MKRNYLLPLAFFLALGLALVMTVGPGRVVDEASARAEQRAAEVEARSQSRLPLPSTTTAAPAQSTQAGSESILAAADALIDATSAEAATALAAAMRDDGDVRWVPYLVDMMRFFGEPVAFALQSLTGEQAPADPAEAFRVYGSWLYANAIDSGPHYIAWKAGLYGLIDGDFTQLIAHIDDPVLAAELQWGGVRRGGIPELNSSPSITVEEATYMQADELTFGAVINGAARAYPHRILDHHELANDILGGEPVALANCTLCRTGVLFSRIVDGEVLYFETSGLLRNSNKVMVDLQTNSLWNQLTGEAIAGPLTGTVLDRYPITVTLYGDWVAEHPDTGVVAIPAGDYNYSYQPGDAYADYYGSDELWFATYEVPDVFEEKAVVATVDLEGVRLAVAVGALAERGPQVLGLGERSLVAWPTAGGVRFYDATGELGVGDDIADRAEGATAGENALALGGGDFPRVQSGHSFWFAWYGNFPDTTWWPVD